MASPALAPAGASSLLRPARPLSRAFHPLRAAGVTLRLPRPASRADSAALLVAARADSGRRSGRCAGAANASGHAAARDSAGAAPSAAHEGARRTDELNPHSRWGWGRAGVRSSSQEPLAGSAQGFIEGIQRTVAAALAAAVVLGAGAAAPEPAAAVLNSPNARIPRR
jgi:hypothetical protein